MKNSIRFRTSELFLNLNSSKNKQLEFNQFEFKKFVFAAVVLNLQQYFLMLKNFIPSQISVPKFQISID